jgi:hypothetical protein
MMRGFVPPPPPPSYVYDWESSTAGNYDLLAIDTVYMDGTNLFSNLHGVTSHSLKNLDNVKLGYVLMKERK